MDPFDRHTISFLAWAKDKDIALSTKIKLADLRDQLAGRGVVAIDDIAEDEDLFSIPRSAILTPETAGLSDEICKEIDDPWLLLILAMVFQNDHHTHSAWKPYFDVLPTSFNSLMFWNEAELQWLQGSAVLDKIGKVKADETFTSVLIPLMRKHNDTFNTTTKTNQELLELCHRMGSTIMAYAFDLEKSGKNNAPDNDSDNDSWEEDSDDGSPLPVGMVPMADMLNADADRNNAKLYYEEEKVVMRSIKNIPAGEEIFNDYGSSPSADLLRRYGYVTQNYAKYDVVEIDQALVRTVSKDIFKISTGDMQQRLDHLEEDMPVDAFDLALSDTMHEQFPTELLAVLHSFVMSKEDFKLKRKAKDSLLSGRPQKEISKVQEALQALLIRRRSQYSSSTLEQDRQHLASMENDPSAYRHSMALRVVIGEKDILLRAFNTIQPSQHTADKKRKHIDLEDVARSVQNDKRQRS